MPEYMVSVKTEALETYFVQADSEQQARENWHDTPCVQSECIDVLQVDIELVDES